MENKKYMVKVMNLFSNLIEVEAQDADEARQKAKDIITNKKENEDIPLFYEVTIPDEHWGVIEKDEFEKIQEQMKAAQEEAAASTPTES
jgi:hypothetical protein